MIRCATISSVIFVVSESISTLEASTDLANALVSSLVDLTKTLNYILFPESI